MTPIFEVETKFRISYPQYVQELPDRLIALGFQSHGQSFQEDHFLPVAVKSDNKRIRFQHTAGVNKIMLTLKQKVEIDGVATRKEQETPLTNDEAQAMLEYARQETGRAVPSFSKFRYAFTGVYGGKQCLVCLDSVDDDNCFMEVEFLVEKEDEVARADILVDKFAIELLGENACREPRSHKEMLFERLGLTH